MARVPNENARTRSRVVSNTAEARGHHSPGRTARVMLAAAVLASSYLDFFGYKAQGYAAVGVWNDRLRGLAPAPEQYRIGIVWLAHLLVGHLHVALPMALASIDCVSGLVAVFVLFDVLENAEVYRNAGRSTQWFGAATFVLLVVWFLGWLRWLQKPETLPAAVLVACLLWLWQPREESGRSVGRALVIVAVGLLLATFRADLAFAVNLGVLWFCMTRREKLALPGGVAIVTSVLGALAPGAIQLMMMLVFFPHASYGRVKIWQLWPNVVHATRWPPFVLFLLPVGWMALEVARRKKANDAAGLAFLAAAILYGLLWVTIGKIDEVRIFLPMALALTPLTAQMAILHVEQQRK